MIRQVCLVSVICSVACNLAPGGVVKRMMSICCSVILMLIILGPLGDFDMGEYANMLARYRELEADMSLEGQQIETRLNRLVIEEELKTYIMDKAKEKDIEILDVRLELEWNTKGCWVPCSAYLYSDDNEDKLIYFSSLLSGELGISEDKIVWQSSR